ncbi:MAG: hypothetical protein LCH77_06020, partial [Actinobacteria bacterium]|nr:hypothetical protein [Actinomycetota bacterium]
SRTYRYARAAEHRDTRPDPGTRHTPGRARQAPAAPRLRTTRPSENRVTPTRLATADPHPGRHWTI